MECRERLRVSLLGKEFEMKTAKQWKLYYQSPEFKQQFIPIDQNLGVSCTDAGTSFLLWSPCAGKVMLNLYKDGKDGRAFQSIPMKKGEKGVWSYETRENLHNVYYDYDLEMEGESIRSADPYAKACGINGRRSMAVDLKKTDPKGWEEDQAPEKQPENIIYEIHVKEFSWQAVGGFPEKYRGKYKAFLFDDTTLRGDGLHPTGIPYLKELGITHIQLMPVFDYGSVDEAGEDTEFNWGYDPVNYNVPEGSYATDAACGEVRIKELKEMIQSLHKNGFRVIMDVVYNHTHGLDSWFQRVVPWYYYRVDENGNPSNGSECGNDIASEEVMCGDYIFKSVLYWAEEYHMDGFRFDLMGLLDTDLMNRIRLALDCRYGKGEKLVFGEPWAAGATAMKPGAAPALKKNVGLLDENIGIFSDDTRDAVKGSVFELEEPGFVNGGKGFEEDILKGVRAWCGDSGRKFNVKAPSQVITYVTSHDNQTLFDKLCDTMEAEELRKKACRLAAGIYMTCQGSLFFLSGEEFARTKEGRDNTYNAPISLNRLDWERAWEERDLVEYYQGLIALRKQLFGLCDKSKEAAKRIYGQWKNSGTTGFFVDNRQEGKNGQWETLLIVYNSQNKAVRVDLPEGDWELLADGKSSFLWKDKRAVSKAVKAEPVSLLVLGKPCEGRQITGMD